jgi:DNA-binding transcriptional LysR family regulator
MNEYSSSVDDNIHLWMLSCCLEMELSMSHLQWDDVRIFLAVAKKSSMSQAAKSLGLGQPTISRRVVLLEEQLGYALFERSVQGATLTDRGRELLIPCERMAEWYAEVARTAERNRSTRKTLRGHVRLTAAPFMAHQLLAPFAASMRAKLPEVSMSVISDVFNLDLARREADVALRAVRPHQRDLVILASRKCRAAAFASKAYVAQYKKSLEKNFAKKQTLGYELLDFIAWAPPHEHLSPNPELAAMIPGFAPAFASNDILVQLRAAEMGCGVIFLPKFHHPLMQKHELVELDFGELPFTHTHLVCAKSALRLPHIEKVAEELAKILLEASDA